MLKNKKGFTLIELLAVIIILGILMIIAIPSVTKYISDSRDNAYISTAKEYVGGARNIVNGGKFSMFNTDATYYIPTKCIPLENSGQSPYGDFAKAYVVTVFDGNGYNYFWTSVDESGIGVRGLVSYDNLDIDDLERDLTVDDIISTKSIGNRSKVIILGDSCKPNDLTTYDATINIDESGENGPFEDNSSNGGGNGSQTGGNNNGTTGGNSSGEDDNQSQGGDLLSTKVKVGDYVIYDAGVWPNTAINPQNSDILSFGGYIKGESRNKSVSCFNGYEELSKAQSGWRVLKIDGNVVTIVHAGVSECFNIYDNAIVGYKWGIVYNAEAVLGKSPSGTPHADYTKAAHDFSYYKNEYAQSVSIITKQMYDEYTGSVSNSSTVTTDTLFYTHLYYWFASAKNESNLWYMQYNGQMGDAHVGSRGIRPVITLKSTVKTVGQSKDAYGHTAWILSN